MNPYLENLKSKITGGQKSPMSVFLQKKKQNTAYTNPVYPTPSGLPMSSIPKTTKPTTTTSNVGATPITKPTITPAKTSAKQNYINSLVNTNTANNIQTQPTIQPPTQPQKPSQKDAYIAAYKSYIDSLKESADVKEAKQAYLDFIKSKKEGLKNIEDQTIPMQFITGQQRSLEDRAGIQEENLLGRIGIAEGAQKATQESLKAGLDLEGKLLDLEKPVEVGGQLYTIGSDGSYTPLLPEKKAGFELGEGQAKYEYNPTTGKYEIIAQRGKTYAPTTGGTIGVGGTTGTLSPLAQAVQKGIITIAQVPAAQRAGVSAELATSGIATNRETTLQSYYDVVNSLINNPNAGKISGYVEGFLGLGNLKPGAQLAKNQYDQLKGILSLENREKLKGSGAISDYEFRVLSQAATALGRNLKDEDFMAQLVKIRDVFEGKYKTLQEGGTQNQTISQPQIIEYNGIRYSVDANGDMTPL